MGVEGFYQFLKVAIFDQKVLELPQGGAAVTITEIARGEIFQIPSAFGPQPLLLFGEAVEFLKSPYRADAPDALAIQKALRIGVEHFGQ